MIKKNNYQHFIYILYADVNIIHNKKKSRKSQFRKSYV